VDFAPEFITQHGSATPGGKVAALAASRADSFSVPVLPLAPKTENGSCLEPAAFSFPNTGDDAISRATLWTLRAWNFQAPAAPRAGRTIPS
jgi:hypothetical protein